MSETGSPGRLDKPQFQLQLPGAVGHEQKCLFAPFQGGADGGGVPQIPHRDLDAGGFQGRRFAWVPDQPPRLNAEFRQQFDNGVADLACETRE